MSITIIGEIGINHNGSLELTKKLIDLSVECGCNAVKFQKRTVDEVYSEGELNKYRESPWGTTNREQKEGLEFGKDEYDEIDLYCKRKNIDWFASAWDMKSQDFLRQYDLKYNKIASAMLTYDDLLEAVAKEKKHTFISTGMSNMDEIDHAVEIFRKHECPFTIMACTSTYPCDISECNVRFVKTLKHRFLDSVGVGYSGHEKGILPSLLAVVQGATVLERHITTDRTQYGSDQAASLGPDGLRRLCRDSREIVEILGDGFKVVYDSEVPIKKKLRKC
jgi:N-acetylneuraminate synthase